MRDQAAPDSPTSVTTGAAPSIGCSVDPFIHGYGVRVLRLRRSSVGSRLAPLNQLGKVGQASRHSGPPILAFFGGLVQPLRSR